MRRVAALLTALLLSGPAIAQKEKVDLALVLAVDVSESIDAERFSLQMQGIAAAFESADVQASVLSGKHKSMLIALVQWSNRPFLVLPWTLLTSADDIRGVASRIRRLRRADSGFTCMSLALRSIADKVLTQLPVPAEHLVVDVSGDGRDNCNPEETVEQVRDSMVAEDITLNGLPILEGDEADTLEEWYRDHVIGGPGSFLLPASGFDDFERAMRRKFVVEISAATCAGCVREVRR